MIDIALQENTRHSIFNPYKILYESLQKGEKDIMATIKGGVYRSQNNYKFFVLFNGQKEWFFSDPCYHDPFDTREKAEIWLNRAKDEILEGVFNPKAWKKNSPVTVSAFSREWLEVIKTKVKDNTYRGYRSSVKNYIDLYLGSVSTFWVFFRIISNNFKRLIFSGPKSCRHTIYI